MKIILTKHSVEKYKKRCRWKITESESRIKLRQLFEDMMNNFTYNDFSEIRINTTEDKLRISSKEEALIYIEDWWWYRIITYVNYSVNWTNKRKKKRKKEHEKRRKNYNKCK